MGPDILCAPFLDGASEREVYLPRGDWYNFNTNKKYEGAKKHTIRMNLDEIPMFVREGTILPLARPVQFVTPQTVFDITCRTYGNNLREAELFEDDGFTFGFENGQYNRISLKRDGKRETVKREGSFREKKYRIISWEHIN
jgi:alpha-D-xyloside xylohydrolase